MTIKNLNRRDFIKTAAIISGSSLLGACANFGLNKVSQATLGRVVIIGGGYAGTTAAKYIRMWSNGNIETVVIEKSSQFVSCPLSNLVRLRNFR